jgi:hypothetical protein
MSSNTPNAGQVSGSENRRAAALTAIIAASVVAWWILVCVLARDVHWWAIALTNVCFAAGLIGSYAAVWAVAIVWSRGVSRRRMAFRAFATTLILLVSMLIVELPATVGMVDYAEWWNRMTGDWDGPSTSFVTDWELGFRHPPHSKWYGRPRSDMAVYWNLPIRRTAPMHFTTDKHGFRNAVDRDVADVVLLGDSYIEGAYVSDDETCAAVLENKSGLRVMNLGLAGYGTLQELEVLIQRAVSMRPRLVAWFFFEGNDLYNDVDFEGSLPFLRERRPYNESRWTGSWSEFCGRSGTRTVFRAVRRALDPIAPNSVATCGSFRDASGVTHQMYYYSYGSLDYDEYEMGCFERTKVAFRRGRDVCRDNDIQLVLFYLPMKFRVYGDLCSFPAASPCVTWKPWDLVDYFQRFCKEESIPCVDLTPLMRTTAMNGELLYAPEDSHWNSQGHAFVADRLLEQWQHYFAPSP